MLIEFIRDNQLNLMLILSGICGLLAVLTVATKTLSGRRRAILVMLELSSMVLLIADRYAYIYRGDVSEIGWWMVRICNFLVYFLSLMDLASFALYLSDLCEHELGLEKIPIRLRVALGIDCSCEILLILSQFYGWFYTFDEQNRYQRTGAFALWFLLPMCISLLLLSVIVQYYKRLTKLIRISMLLFAVAPLVASVLQVFLYGLSLTNLTMVGTVILLYIFALLDLNNEIERANKRELALVNDEKERLQLVFSQTAEALANAIDAKDKYTHGHSRRVAWYSRKIAEEAGKSPDECQEIYFAALLHDVGKIGVPGNILNKEGKLTDEEFAAIKMHPVIGRQILSTISESPYLSVGAHYHHERYDGRGYPEGLKGADIPDIARIICVADAYDAMTSRRSYRETMPQMLVREEFVKGIETQFDPAYAIIMLDMMDRDTRYKMKEREEVKELAGQNELICNGYRENVSEGIRIQEKFTTINLNYEPHEGFDRDKSIPSIILFDSMDERIQVDEVKIRQLGFIEYGEISIDGKTDFKNARNVTVEVRPKNCGIRPISVEKHLEIRAVKYRDHALIRLDTEERTVGVTVALPDSTRYLYIALTGQHCTLSDVKIDRSKDSIAPDFIPRIAEEIDYIKNAPVGDIPNIQIEGARSATTVGIPFKKEISVSFHAKSLETARLIWHCPYFVLYSSQTGKLDDEGTLELACYRSDGESTKHPDRVKNHTIVDRLEGFESWEIWKEHLKEGVDCTASVKRSGKTFTVQTDVAGISATHTLEVSGSVTNLNLALTGDQCVLTDIKCDTDISGTAAQQN